MSVKVTQKQVKNNYSNIVSVGYCGLSRILSYFNPSYYTAGAYGWNADIYDFGNFCICTGYRPFGNINLSFQQEKIIDEMEFPGTWEEQKKQAYKFIKSYIIKHANLKSHSSRRE